MKLKNYFSRKLGWRETVVIVCLAGIFAGLGYAAYIFGSQKLLEAKVKASLPKMRSEIRVQLGTLVKAIEAYKVKFGDYPPDHVLSRQPLVVDPVTNTLIYELAGVIHDSTNNLLQLAGLEAAEFDYVTNFLQSGEMKNSGKSAGEITSFIDTKRLPFKQLHDDPDVFVLSFDPSFPTFSWDVLASVEVGSWRYVKSGATNNPGKFDLWIELRTKKSELTVGNWKAVE